MSEVQYNPSKVINIYFRYKFENKQKNERNNILALYNVLDEQIRQTESRFEQSEYSTKNTSNAYGTIIYQDLKFKFYKNKFTINTRLALFDIDEFNTRIYAFEDNVPYTYSVPMFQNSGTRFYLMANYKITKNIKVFARFSNTQYNNLKSIGSGLEQINGNTQSDLIIQFQMSF